MAQNKTQPTAVDPLDFITNIDHKTRREDGLTLLNLFTTITKKKAVMWGPSIIGFGSYHYKYDSGREGDFLITGFSPRKQNLSIYIMPGFTNYQKLLDKLGKYKTGSSCLYINKLADVDLKILEELIREFFNYMIKKHSFAS